MRILTISLCLIAYFTTDLASQTGWVMEGAFRRYHAPFEISSAMLGCDEGTGNPIVEEASALTEVPLTTNNGIQHNKPQTGTWTFLPRSPHVMASAEPSGDGASTTIRFNDVWQGAVAREIEGQINTTDLVIDQKTSWIADDKTVGCVVFAPTAATPSEKAHFVIVIFKGEEITYSMRVKKGNDLDIYVRPEPDYGVLVYLRGNGISFPPNEEEVFTYGNYLMYEPDGKRTTLNIVTRGPGSGKGRKIIWHSNKWDRLLLTDEFASGSLLIKATNGIVVDSIVSSKIDAGQPLKIISASADARDRWMTTHARVGDKNAIILWAMPTTIEGQSELFASNDVATKQMSSSPWSLMIPFISSSTSGNALYAWDAQDLVGIPNSEQRVASGSGEQRVASSEISPTPAISSVRINDDALQGDVHFDVTSTYGSTAASGFATASDGSISIGVDALCSGVYTAVLKCGNTVKFARFIVER